MNLKYELLKKDDVQLINIKKLYALPEIEKWISISDNFFDYLLESENVYLMKIIIESNIAGCIHFEIYNNVMYLSIIVDPNFQRLGIGKKSITHIMQQYKCAKYYACIEKDNMASIKLFESLGFSIESIEDEIINYMKA